MSETPLPAMPDYCWPVDVSCVKDWDEWEVEPDPETDEPGVPLYSAHDKARAIALAGQTLRMLTGYRVGGCPITVRPCVTAPAEPTWRTYPVTGVADLGSWRPLGCGCSRSSCGCTGATEVTLGTVGSVVLVMVDGMILDPSAYRLEGRGVLVRTDGDVWPLRQDLSLPDTEPGTWSVTYVPGAPVDGLGAAMAGVLAGEYVRACVDGDCRLPTGVQTVVRQGVTLTLGVGAFPDGKTGLREVDAWIERWNPHALTGPSMVMSPDVRRPRRVRP